jgi:predicted Rdx family selenoprotein
MYIKIKKKTMKQNINEMKRMQQLAGLIKENLNEDDLYEMARTAGTGGAFTITPEGEDLLRKLKGGMELPADVRTSHVAILVWLFNAKKEGKRVQKADYARERGVLQPVVNPLFNQLENLGYAQKEGYVGLSPKSPGGGSKPTTNVEDLLSGLDIDTEEDI